MTDHEHQFTALWFHWGPNKTQDVHVHQCFDGRCGQVKVGDGRRCNPANAHHEESP
jgi:hypothetical protein